MRHEPPDVTSPLLKPLEWIASSRKDLKALPEEVQDVFGYALQIAQEGSKTSNAKPLRGFSGAGVLEVADYYDGDTYRAVYTVKFAYAVYVLHVFQKKSKRGIATPESDMELIELRFARRSNIMRKTTSRQIGNKRIPNNGVHKRQRQRVCRFGFTGCAGTPCKSAACPSD